MGRVGGNLLSKAARCSPEGAKGGGGCGLLDGRQALTVENTGARISEEALPHLFEAFYREEGSRSRATGGSGLGLYLVKMILDRHGAACKIEIRWRACGPRFPFSRINRPPAIDGKGRLLYNTGAVPLPPASADGGGRQTR